MASILIAYNNDTSVELHEFLDMCGDDMKQFCYDRKVGYSTLVPPDLTEKSVMYLMTDHQVCCVAAHGYTDGICNEKDEDIISVHTTNYNLQNKVVYCVSCHCAVNLCPCLMQIGVKLFVGYNDAFEVRGEYAPFIVCALSGIKCLLSGNDVKEARSKMNQIYDEQIDLLNQSNPWTAMSLLHNKEALVFEGEDNYTL